MSLTAVLWEIIYEGKAEAIEFDWELVYEGAGGSGNYAHLGRPGDLGGSTAQSKGSGAVLSTLIQKEREQAAADKGWVQGEIESSLMPGMQMIGLEYAVKGDESLARKIAEVKEELNVASDTEVLKCVTDVLRFTAIADDGKYGSGVQTTLDNLKAQGWDIYEDVRGKAKFRNAWAEEGAYKGVNTVMRKGERVMELQFHTAKSWDVKERAHGFYEKARVAAKGSPEHMKWTGAMNEAWASITIPPKAETIAWIGGGV